MLAGLGYRATGIDVSPEMVKLSRAAADGSGLAVQIFLGDMLRMPLEWERRFDALVCTTALQHIPTSNGAYARALREFGRVLKAGGLAHIDARIGCDPGFDPDLRFIQTFESPVEVVEHAKAAGFELIEDFVEHDIKSGENSFRREVPMRFADFWFRLMGTAQ